MDTKVQDYIVISLLLSRDELLASEEHLLKESSGRGPRNSKDRWKKIYLLECSISLQ